MRTMHGGTYNSNPLVCAAVIAACEQTGRPGFYHDLERRGSRLADGIVELARSAGLPACWVGTGGMFQTWFADAPPGDYREAQGLAATSPFFALHASLRRRGVLIQPPQEGLWLMSGVHTDDQIDQTLEAVSDAMTDVTAAVHRGEVGPMGGLR